MANCPSQILSFSSFIFHYSTSSNGAGLRKPLCIVKLTKVEGGKWKRPTHHWQTMGDNKLYFPDSMANEEDVDDLITFSDFRTAFDILVKLRRDLIITIDGSVDDDRGNRRRPLYSLSAEGRGVGCEDMAVRVFGFFSVGVVSWGLLLIDYINFNMEI